MANQFENHNHFGEPSLHFDRRIASASDIHPLRGLLQNGPFSKDLLPGPIRVATIAPHNESRRVFAVLKELRQVYAPAERKDYLAHWPGFEKVFGIEFQPADSMLQIQLDSDLDREITSNHMPHRVLLEALLRAVTSSMARRHAYDVMFIYLPQRWEVAFHGAEGEDYDLHDQIKAFTAMNSIPVQIVRENGAVAYSDRASVMWRLGLALYVKAGGIPWKLKGLGGDEAFIGLSYSVSNQPETRNKMITCCSQVFDSEGAGLEFVAYNTHEFVLQKDNPFLTQNEMFRVMTRSMELYRRRHAGRYPRRVTVHKTSEFKHEEIEGCMEAFHLCDEINLIQIVSNVPWRGIRMRRDEASGKGVPHDYPIERGTLLQIGAREALLWTHGSVAGIGNRDSYFQGAKSIPSPLKLIRFAGHGPWDSTAMAILGLTKMNWNNDALYDALPVTLSYAHVLARVMQRIDTLGAAPYQFRFFM